MYGRLGTTAQSSEQRRSVEQKGAVPTELQDLLSLCLDPPFVEVFLRVTRGPPPVRVQKPPGQEGAGVYGHILTRILT